MSVWYSDHYGADGTSDNSIASPPNVVSVGVKHGRIRYARATLTGLCLDTEVMRYLTLKSSDRILEIMISSDGGSTAAAANYGVYKAGNAHDGAVLDADLFASAQALSTAIARTDIFNESAVLQHEDRGKQLWELVVVGADPDSYTADPQILMDICGVVSTTFTDAVSITTLEVYYTSGD